MNSINMWIKRCLGAAKDLMKVWNWENGGSYRNCTGRKSSEFSPQSLSSAVKIHWRISIPTLAEASLSREVLHFLFEGFFSWWYWALIHILKWLRESPWLLYYHAPGPSRWLHCQSSPFVLVSLLQKFCNSCDRVYCLNTVFSTALSEFFLFADSIQT